MTKILKSIFSISLLSLALALGACSDDNGDGTKTGNVIEPIESVTLNSKDDLILNIPVESSISDWKADTEATWLDVDGSGSNLKIEAEPNPKAYLRSTIVNLRDQADNVIVQFQVAQQGANHRYEELFTGGMPISGVSNNGRYAVGCVDVISFILDMTDIDDESNFTVLNLDEFNYTSAAAVSNDGTVIGSYEGYPAYWKDGSWTKLDLSIIGVNNTAGDKSYKGHLSDITADGTTMVGVHGTAYNTGEITIMEVPIMWKNGVTSVLESPVLPRPGFPNSELRGYVAVGISDDASIIVGRSVDDYANWVGAMWTPQYGIFMSETYDYFDNAVDGQTGEPIDDMLKRFPRVSGITPNGKYIYGEFFETDGRLNIKQTPYIYDTDTKTYTLVDGYDDAIIGRVTNDGTIFFGTPHREYIREGFVYQNGKVTTFSQWIWDNYGMEVNNEITVTGISEDLKVIAGICYNEGGWYNKVFFFE